MCNSTKTPADKVSIGNNMDDEPICDSGTTNSCWNAKMCLFQRQSKLFLRCESSDKIYQPTKEVSYYKWEEYCKVLCDHKEYKAILSSFFMI